MTIQAFVFDLDGVITNTAQYHFHAWQRLARRLGFDFDEAFDENLKGISRMEALDILLAHGGVTLTPEQKQIEADRKNADFVASIELMSDKDILPGAREALENIHAAGLKTALASASKNAPTILKKLGIDHLFDAIVDVNLLKNGKPDPEIFIKGAELVGADPKNCIGVEDAVAGVHAIKAAGMYAVGIGSADLLKDADVVISGLDKLDLPAVINAAIAQQNH